MKKSNRRKLSYPCSANGFLTFVASIIFGSFAFATSNLDINLQSPSSSVEKNHVASAVAPNYLASAQAIQFSERQPEIIKLDRVTATRLALRADAAADEAMESPSSESSFTSDDTTAQKTLVLVLLSVLSGDR